MLEPRTQEGTGDSQRVRQARVATDKVVEQLATLAVVGADVVVVVVTASGFWIHEVGTMFPPNPLATVFAISSSPIS